MTLHSLGYVVLRAAVTSEAAVVRNALLAHASTCAKPFLNFGDYSTKSESSPKRRRLAAEDRRRRQAPLPADANGALLKNAVNAMLQRHGIVTLDNGLAATDWVVIHSRPGCRRQAAHADYEPSDALRAVDDAHMPLGVLVALMSNTHFHAWPGSIRLIQRTKRSAAPRKAMESIDLVLDAGDVLVFRADLIHAGAEYDADNVRVHAFVDSRRVPRKAGGTYIVSRCDDAPLQRAILSTV